MSSSCGHDVILLLLSATLFSTLIFLFILLFFTFFHDVVVNRTGVQTLTSCCPSDLPWHHLPFVSTRGEKIGLFRIPFPCPRLLSRPRLLGLALHSSAPAIRNHRAVQHWKPRVALLLLPPCWAAMCLFWQLAENLFFTQFVFHTWRCSLLLMCAFFSVVDHEFGLRLDMLWSLLKTHTVTTTPRSVSRSYLLQNLHTKTFHQVDSLENLPMDLAYMCVKHQMRLYVCHQMRLYVCHQMRSYVCHQIRLYVCHQIRLYVCHQMRLLTQRSSLRSLTFARFARTFFW